MMPESLTPTSERGFYIVWDPQNWRKERVVSLSHAESWCFSPLSFPPDERKLTSFVSFSRRGT